MTGKPLMKLETLRERMRKKMAVKGKKKVTYCSKCGEKIILFLDAFKQLGINEEITHLCSRCRRKYTAGRMKETIEPMES